MSDAELQRTVLCRNWYRTDQCRWAARCRFAHALDELRPMPSRLTKAPFSYYDGERMPAEQEVRDTLQWAQWCREANAPVPIWVDAMAWEFLVVPYLNLEGRSGRMAEADLMENMDDDEEEENGVMEAEEAEETEEVEYDDAGPMETEEVEYDDEEAEAAEEAEDEEDGLIRVKQEEDEADEAARAVGPPKLFGSRRSSSGDQSAQLQRQLLRLQRQEEDEAKDDEAEEEVVPRQARRSQRLPKPSARTTAPRPSFVFRSPESYGHPQNISSSYRGRAGQALKPVPKRRPAKQTTISKLLQAR